MYKNIKQRKNKKDKTLRKIGFFLFYFPVKLKKKRQCFLFQPKCYDCNETQPRNVTFSQIITK